MTNTNETKKPLYIEVTQPEKFEKLAATTMETTQRLAKRINKLMLSTFADFHGTVITSVPGNGNVANNQQFMVELHFKPLMAGSIDPSDGRVRAFKPIDEASTQGDIVAGLKNIYGSRRSSAKFEMTLEAANILSEFMLPGVNIDAFKPSSYSAFKFEYIENSVYGQAPILVKVTHLDLTKLIRKIYGNKNEDGKKVEYGIIPYGPVAPTMNNPMVQANANWRLIIMQVEAEKTFDLASEFGLIPAGNGGAGPVVTGTV